MLSGGQLSDRFLLRKGLVLVPLAGQTVIGIRQRYHLCCDGDVIALPAIGIAAAVPALMVPAADLDRKFHQRLVLILGQIFQHLRTQNGVGVEDGGLFRRQVVGAEDVVVDSNFADVMEGRGRRDEVAVHSVQAVDVGLLAQTLQQDAGDALHPGDVVDALAVVDLRDLAEDADHDLVVLLPVIELLGHQRTETALTGVEPGDIGDAAVDDAGIEGAADVVRSTQLVGAADGLGGILAGDHHDGDVLEPALGGHPGEDIEAVHVGHHDVQQHDGNIRAPGVQKLEALGAVGGFQDLEIVAEDLREDVTVHGGVVHDEHHRTVVIFRADGIGGDVLGDDSVLAVFCKVHPLVGDGQGIADGDAGGHHAADAGRDVHLLELGQMGREEALVDVLELAHESLSRDVRQDEQQLVAAVPHQHIGGADAAVDDGDDEPERCVTG